MNYCPKCGKKLDKQASFCTGCGARIKPATEAAPIIYNDPPSPGPRRKRKNNTINIILLAVLLVLLGGLFGILFFRGKGGDPLAKQLSLGERYLSEMDYERAVAAFQEAVEIDPKSKQAYMGLADSYAGLADVTEDHEQSIGYRNDAVEAYQEVLNLDPEDMAAKEKAVEQYRILYDDAVAGNDEEKAEQISREITNLTGEEPEPAPETHEETHEEYKAYLSILQDYQDYIMYWEGRIAEYNGYDYSGARRWDGHQIAVYDIDGDGIDELLFVAETDEKVDWQPYQMDLYIYSYQDGQAVKILQKDVFTEAAGGRHYMVVTSGEKEITIVDTAVDEFYDTAINEYQKQGSSLVQLSFLGLFRGPHYEENAQGYYEWTGDEFFISHDQGNGQQEISEAEYVQQMELASEDFGKVILFSDVFELPIYEVAGEQQTGAMNYEEASSFLTGEAGGVQQ